MVITTGGKVLGEAVAEVEALTHKYLPAGYSYGFAGQAEAFKESFQYLIMALVQAIVIVYMVLAMQFNSFLHPLTSCSLCPEHGRRLRAPYVTAIPFPS